MSAFDGVHGTVCNEQQYNQSLLSSASPSPSISYLTRGQSTGLALTAEASLLSCISVIVVFIWMGWNIRWYRKTFPKGDWKLFRWPADVYMFSLFVFDFFQGVGGALDIKWAQDGVVTTGHYCTAQGTIQQFGELGVALITLLLAVHTFMAALWRVGLQARGVALGLVCLVCLFVTLWVSIGASTNTNYETPTPYWCWISPEFLGQRLWGEYIWMWLALFASVILYIPLYYWAEGRLSIDEECWYRVQMSNTDQRVEYAQRRAALGMLLYPLAYSLVVLPISIIRWSTKGHHHVPHHVPSAATFFAVIMSDLSGAINVVLFLIVRPQLLLFPRPEELDGPEIELAPQSTGPAITNLRHWQRSPEPTTTVLADEGSRHNAALFRSSSRRVDDI